MISLLLLCLGSDLDDNELNYELGFHQGDMGLAYIARSDEREPLDQTDLSNGLDVILRLVINRHTKDRLPGGPTRPRGLAVRPAGPPCQGLMPEDL